MKMRQLRIHNYRSIKDLTIQVPDMLVLVGPNNSGKSNILRAIEFGLSASAKPNPEDFFSFRSEDELWAEMTFDCLTEQEESTFREYLSSEFKKSLSLERMERLKSNKKGTSKSRTIGKQFPRIP